MGTNIPTSANIWRKVHLVWLALFNPDMFIAEENKDNETLNTSQARRDAPPIHAVRSALRESLIWCVLSVAAGIVVGIVTARFAGGGSQLAAITAVVGTAVLLWSTLALQGWNIQTFRGVTLTERVNRWIFRGLYCLGTFLIAFGTVWAVA